jgi:hypothetical protein
MRAGDLERAVQFDPLGLPLAVPAQGFSAVRKSPFQPSSRRRPLCDRAASLKARYIVRQIINVVSNPLPPATQPIHLKPVTIHPAQIVD